MWDEWQYCLILNAAASTTAYCLFNLNYIQTIYVDIQLWRDFKIHKVHLKHFRQTYKSFSFIRVHQCLKIKSTDVWTEIEIGMTTYMFYTTNHKLCPLRNSFCSERWGMSYIVWGGICLMWLGNKCWHGSWVSQSQIKTKMVCVESTERIASRTVNQRYTETPHAICSTSNKHY